MVHYILLTHYESQLKKAAAAESIGESRIFICYIRRTITNESMDSFTA